MTEKKTPAKEELVACEICLTEIPISEAKNDEVNEYVRHFCGLECYGKWMEQKPDETERE